VSNIGRGDPTARDDNGFVSRVAPDGRVLSIRWISGGQRGVELDGPKGLAIHGDTLAIADVGGVRLFDRRTGAPLGYVPLPGVLMNDLAYAPDGSLWVTDTGPDRPTRAAPDTTRDLDAVWRIDRRGHAEAVARGTALGRPDGIVLDGAGALVATFGANRLERVGAGIRGNWSTHATLPAGRIDGLRRLSDSALLATSWDAHSVWLLRPGASPHVLLTDVDAPAGIAVDRHRHRLAVTSMQKNALYLLPFKS
jgi:sugar lactone lactonase YvrE